MSTNAYPRLSTVDDTSSIDRSIDPQEVTFLGNGGGANTASGGGSSSGLLSKFFKKTTITTTTTSSMATTGGANKAGEIASMFVDGSHALAQPGREFVKEGMLVKMCRKAPKPRYFALFNDLLIYGTVVVPHTANNAKMVCANQHIINLNELAVSLIEETHIKFGFQLGTPKKSFQVFAQSAEEKEEWLAVLAKYIVDPKARQLDVAAVWLPDKEANACMICEFARFSTFNRRHHCRKCGVLVCGSCSSQRRVILAGSDPVRVCDNCAEGVTTDATTKAQRKERAIQRASATIADEFGVSSDSDEGEGDEVTTQKDKHGRISFTPAASTVAPVATPVAVKSDGSSSSTTRKRHQFKRAETPSPPPSESQAATDADNSDAAPKAVTEDPVPTTEVSINVGAEDASSSSSTTAPTGGGRRRHNFKK